MLKGHHGNFSTPKKPPLTRLGKFHILAPRESNVTSPKDGRVREAVRFPSYGSASGGVRNSPSLRTTKRLAAGKEACAVRFEYNWMR